MKYLHMQFYYYRVKFCAGMERKRQNKKQNKTKIKKPHNYKAKKIFFVTQFPIGILVFG